MCGPAELCGKFVKGLHYGSKITRTGVLDYVKPDVAAANATSPSSTHARTDKYVERSFSPSPASVHTQHTARC